MERPAEPAHAESGPRDFILDDLDLPPPSTARRSAAAGRRRRPAAPAAPPPPAVRASAGSRPAFMRVTDPVLRWGPLALLAFAPLAWGSVEAWSEMVVVAAPARSAPSGSCGWRFFPECCAADRSAGGHIGSWSAGLLIPLIAVLGVGVRAVGAARAPGRPGLAGRGGDPAPGRHGAGSLTFSMARQETLRALAQYAGYRAAVPRGVRRPPRPRRGPAARRGYRGPRLRARRGRHPLALPEQRPGRIGRPSRAAVRSGPTSTATTSPA